MCPCTGAPVRIPVNCPTALHYCPSQWFWLLAKALVSLAAFVARASPLLASRRRVSARLFRLGYCVRNPRPYASGLLHVRIFAYSPVRFNHARCSHKLNLTLGAQQYKLNLTLTLLTARRMVLLMFVHPLAYASARLHTRAPDQLPNTAARPATTSATQASLVTDAFRLLP